MRSIEADMDVPNALRLLNFVGLKGVESLHNPDSNCHVCSQLPIENSWHECSARSRNIGCSTFRGDSSSILQKKGLQFCKIVTVQDEDRCVQYQRLREELAGGMFKARDGLCGGETMLGNGIPRQEFRSSVHIC
jgi:hypothetical protein